MNYIKWAESKIINFKWYDIGLIKLSVFFFALLIAKLCPDVLGFHWGLYLVWIGVGSTCLLEDADNLEL